MNILKKENSCCFTGHRPEKLNMPEGEIKKELEKAIKQAISDGFTTFISGMARGVDMWAAELVLKEKENNDKITLVCAIPFEGFEKRWDYTEKNRYNSIIKKADYIKFVCEHYSKSCFQIRNCYMVNNSSRIIAAYNGNPGGTRNTIIYAQKSNTEIVNICSYST